MASSHLHLALGLTKVAQGSDYTQHVGKRCVVNAAAFCNLPGKILSLQAKGKYLVELDPEHAYLNHKTGKTTTWCRINCTQAWV